MKSSSPETGAAGLGGEAVSLTWGQLQILSDKQQAWEPSLQPQEIRGG